MEKSYPVGPQKQLHDTSSLSSAARLVFSESVTVVGYSGWLSVQLCRRVIPSLETQSWPRELFVHQEDLVRQVQTRKKKKKKGNKNKNKTKNKKEREKTTTQYRKHPPSFLKISLAGSNSKQLHFYPALRTSEKL